MDFSVDERVNELFGMLICRYARLGVPPFSLKKELYRDIAHNITYFWEEYEANPNDFLLHMYESWLTFEDRVETLVKDLKGYEMLYNMEKARKINFSLN